MKIELHIERLVLDGFAPGSIDGERVRNALGAELTRLLQQAPMGPTCSVALPSVRATMPAPGVGGQAGAVGVGVANALYGISHGGSEGSR